MNFKQRWNDPKSPKLHGKFEALSTSDTSRIGHVVSKSNIPAKAGSQSVQIVRTFSCKAKKYYRNFAPRGEISILQGRIKAILQAKNYIYIIDQYFVYHKELLHALLTVLPRLQKLVLFIREIGPEFMEFGYDKFQFEQIEKLRNMSPNKVHIYTTADASIYVHSKTMIIDDMFLAIGSANWNGRSMSSDSEIAAHVVDTEHVATPDGIYVGKFIRDYRLRKFAEMGNVEPHVLSESTFVDTIHWLDERAINGNSLIKRYEPDRKPGYNRLGRWYQMLTDSEQRCDSMSTESICENKEWLSTQPPMAHHMCKCIQKGLSPNKHLCKYMRNIPASETLQATYQKEGYKSAASFILFLAVLILISLILLFQCIQYVLHLYRRTTNDIYKKY